METREIITSASSGGACQTSSNKSVKESALVLKGVLSNRTPFLFSCGICLLTPFPDLLLYKYMNHKRLTVITLSVLVLANCLGSVGFIGHI